VTASATGQTRSIVTRGRRSGTEHVVRVWFVVTGEHFYAAARAGLRSDWLQNALHAGWLEIRAGGSSRRGPASLAPADEVPAIIDAFAEKYGRYRQVIDAWRREPPVFVKVRLGPEPDELG
jgi:hypothetical protein